MDVLYSKLKLKTSRHHRSGNLKSLISYISKLLTCDRTHWYLMNPYPTNHQRPHFTGVGIQERCLTVFQEAEEDYCRFYRVFGLAGLCF